jgi:hypothetical protein
MILKSSAGIGRSSSVFRRAQILLKGLVPPFPSIDFDVGEGVKGIGLSSYDRQVGSVEVVETVLWVVDREEQSLPFRKRVVSEGERLLLLYLLSLPVAP